MAVLGIERLALREFELFAAQLDGLALQADQIHLDPLHLHIVGGVMDEGVQVEVGAQFAVGAQQDVLVEARRDAGGVVVGGMQPRRVLHQVDADQQAAAIQGCRASGAAGTMAASGRKLPMVEPGKKPARRVVAGNRQRQGEVGHDGRSVQRGIIHRQVAHHMAQIVAGDIQRQIGARLCAASSRMRTLRRLPAPNSTISASAPISAAISPAWRFSSAVSVRVW